MKKAEVVEREREKLNKIFENIDENQRLLVEGLIDDASFLFGENFTLKQTLDKTGTVKINPENEWQQKQLPAATQYLKNLSAYAIVIKSLYTILNRQNTEDDDDGLGDFE